MNIAVLFTPDIWAAEDARTQRINATFILEGNAPIPNLHKCVYVRLNHSWSSLTYKKKWV